ncbi:choice-of-anchor M domain-containing protein [Corynebacterium sp. ES2794-CONJ1]|uniref:choice-of-anchor M domain-containing protein n=1 Tax=unclassified Corynebacterium TaxID=2624378 RepID=UPI0021699777|nr:MULTISPECIES: choice-of-anchor M domain-containing protein [unclassified Corynebacterium]MCS4489971.1 choice-of-anchor M domain-containing protein [Corynebacterium sp. ES2775-CONJ]MCS4491666.1 choice-of-anchor M domain-containing protein [Corynebacterium sp. ES2715-CONJ3]MCS4531771.1 choice-of-anchor M domain-containing protein [Corynebacterium sp. ES2730-CONJ]MCU9519167.1 choice-of-anchor M domain-containing protein [Corynebacterium sp. ES2794-CONJ1]
MFKEKVAALTASLCLGLCITPSISTAGDLNQVISADEPIAPEGELTEFFGGHADIAPLVKTDGSGFDVLIRDDRQVPPVWRSVDDMIFVLDNKAVQQIPDTEEFAFIGAKPGAKVWVAPQVEEVGVPWLGWSTQSPLFVDKATRGMNMTFLGHEGPGEFTLFLQNGGFEAPQVLFNSAQQKAQKIWIDLNTHTHANWVFTEPGIQQVALKFSTEFNDGSTHESIKTLVFAVGEEADLPAAQAVTWDGEFLADDDDTVTPGPASSAEGESQWVLWSIIALVALLVIVSIIAVVRLVLGSNKRGAEQN